MNDDELMRWLDEDFEEWRPPLELRQPTGSAFINFVIAVLGSKVTSNAINAAIGSLLAERERFTLSHLEKKRAQSDRDMLSGSMESSRGLEQCWAAWVRYLDSFDTQGNVPSAADYDNLLKVLQESAERYIGLRST